MARPRKSPDLLRALTECGEQLAAPLGGYELLVSPAELPAFVAALRDAVCQDLQLLADAAWQAGQLRPVKTAQQLVLPFHAAPARSVGRSWTRISQARANFRRLALAS